MGVSDTGSRGTGSRGTAVGRTVWRSRRVRTVAVAFGVVATLTACGADRDDSLRVTSVAPTTTTLAPGETAAPVETFAPNGETVDVLSLDNNFIVQHITVEAGTEVIWFNNGRNDHNILPADDPEATTWGALTEDFAPTMEYSKVFDTPGVYVYYCSIHGTPTAAMFGSVTVVAP
jgi:plastocyanin